MSTRGDRLPTFIVIGTMKGGTTSLWEYLRAHPQVFMPESKEIQFFSNPGRYERGLDWYREHFADVTDEIAVGEASTNYTKHPRRTGTAGRIAEVMPDVRLVYLLRNPIERIRSHYVQLAHGHGERRPLSVVVRENPELLDISRYSMQIDQYLEHFDAGQLLVITSEALHADRERTLSRAFAFLGVDETVPPIVKKTELHRSADKRFDTRVSTWARRLRGYDFLRRIAPDRVKRATSRATKRSLASEVDATITDELRRELVAELRDDVGRLRPFLGSSFDGWGMLPRDGPSA